MGKLSDMLVGLQELKTYVDTLLQAEQSKSYISVESNLILYSVKLAEKETNVKSELQKLLPEIKGRKDGKNEKDLMLLLNKYNTSPFNTIKSKIFLDSRALEIEALNLLMKDLDGLSQKNFKIADYKLPKKASLMLDFSKVVHFSINILQSEKVTIEFLRSAKLTQTDFWYNDDKKASALGKQKRLFTHFIAANKHLKKVGFFIDLRDEIQPFEITVQENGIKVGDFIIPENPNAPDLLTHTDNQFTIAIEKPNNKWITKFLVNYSSSADDFKELKTMEFPFTSLAKTNATIKELIPLTTYQYQLIYYTEFGVTKASEVSQVTTSPCSEPKNLKFEEVTENSFLVSWNIPACGNKIIIDRYKITLKGKVIISLKDS